MPRRRAGEVRDALSVDTRFYFRIWPWHREGLGWDWHDRAKHPCRLSEARTEASADAAPGSAGGAARGRFPESSGYPKRLPPARRLT